MSESARATARDALVEIEAGAYANLALPRLLDHTDLEGRDRAFTTELVYGTTRMRRACDWLIDQFITRPVDVETRAVLRLGAYQLAFLHTPPHAAVGATVDIAPKRAAGFVNAVLRKVAAIANDPKWPDSATELSYPDWIVERLTTELGADAAEAALRRMNEPPAVTERADGYVQDEASQLVAESVGAQPGDRIADLCAAPGGKATGLDPRAFVAASDVNRTRVGLIESNIRRLRADNVALLVADGRMPPYKPRAFDRVLLDAPCSGLGVLRRRPDARWRIQPDDVPRLAALQRDLLDAALTLAMPGGLVVYSVCTLTLAETAGIDKWLADTRPGLKALPPPAGPWERFGRGARLLPQTADTDGMYVLRVKVGPA
ncbi:MAG TPA: transcription antitermination factor NusB [Acidimicrobiales bacterium]|nr:transcription antitermination factor NusB [Acidimicrobiales bacterium]